MKKLLVILIAGLAIYGFLEKNPTIVESYAQQSIAGDQQIADAYQNQQSNVQVAGSGAVIRILPDDTEGSQHQKFILNLQSGQTLLISHNIDLAPRMDALREGDTVGFYGEYEWNPQGGVVHWTHHDPGGSHEDGWLKHKGATYQ